MPDRHTPRRAALIVTLVVAGVAVLACSRGPAAGGDPVAQDAPPTPRVAMTVPATVGGWKRAADQAKDTATVSALSEGLRQPFAVRYEQPADPAQTVTVWGGTGTGFQVDDAQWQFDTFFAKLNKQLGSSHPTAPTSAGVIRIGGRAACADTDRDGAALTACAWTGPGVMVALLFQGIKFDDAGQHLNVILYELVTMT